MIKPNK